MRRRHTGPALLAAIVLAALVPIATAEAKRNLYVTGSASGTVAGFDLGQGGQPLPLAGSPYAAPTGASGLVLSPDGRRAYVGGQAQLAGYAVAPNGTLSPIAGSPYATASSPTGVAVSPDGRHLYAASFNSNVVSAYAIAGDGSLAAVPGSPFATGTTPQGVAVSPEGRHLFVANQFGESISAYAIAANGSLAEIAGSPFATSAGPRGLAVSPDGTRLFVANSFADVVSAYAVGPAGTLSPIVGSPFAAGGEPYALSLSPSGRHLYVTHEDTNAVFAYAVAASGALAAVPGSPFATGAASRGAVVSPDGRRLYVTSTSDDSVSVYDIAASGALTGIAGSPFAAGVAEPYFQAVAITPNQGPVAALSAAGAEVDRPVSFDARGSTDPDGKVIRYDWTFGDGAALPDGGPTPTHVYEALGRYIATVTVTDDEGCSRTRLFTGQTVHCNGSAVASASLGVAVHGTPADTGVSIRVGGRKLRLDRRRRTKVRLTCPAAEASGPCRGRLVLRTRSKLRLKGKRRRLMLARGRFEIPAGRARAVKLRLSRRQARLVRTRRGARRVNAIVSVRDRVGNRARVVKKLKLVPVKRRRARLAG